MIFIHALVLPGSMSRNAVRLALFTAVSVLLHAVTIFSVGPFQLTGFGPGAGPWGSVLHATLAPAPRPEADDDAAAPVRDAAPADGKAPSAVQGDQASASITPEPLDRSAREEKGLALPVPEKWYTAREVDVRAEPLTPVPLGYPERLRGTLSGGTVQLRLYIDERGVVRKMQIAAAEPPGLFEEAARSAWQEVRFKPALKDGAPVKSQKLIEVLYRPD